MKYTLKLTYTGLAELEFTFFAFSPCRDAFFALRFAENVAKLKLFDWEGRLLDEIDGEAEIQRLRMSEIERVKP